MVEELGSEVHVLFGVDAPPVSSDAVRAAEEADEDGGARLIHDEAERSQFTARVSADSRSRRGEPITLTVDTARCTPSTPPPASRSASRR